MPLDPDTEIQYRRGGKIMKKSPRKFQAGGAATPAPATKPAPKRVTTPSDQPDAKTTAEMRRQAAEAKMDEGQRKAAEDFYSDKQRLGNKMKKGGRVRKFNEGGDVTQDTRERRADEEYKTRSMSDEVPGDRSGRGSSQLPQKLAAPDKSEDFSKAVSPETDWPQSVKYGRFDDDTYRRAYAQADKPATPKKEDSKASKPAPKPTPKAAPKAATSNPRKAGNDPESYSRREEQTEPQIGNKAEPKKDYGSRGNMSRTGDFELSPSKSRSAESSDSGKDVTQRIKDSLARTRAGSDSSDSRSVSDRLRAFAGENPNATKALEVGSMLIPAGGLGIAATRAARAAYMAKKARDAGKSVEAATAARAAPTPSTPTASTAEAAPAMTKPLTGQERKLRDLNARNRQALDEKDAAQADRVMAAGKDRADTDRRVKQSMRDFVQSGNYKKGGKVAKYAKGGGVEAKGKTKGKIVKMATGGSVRGYGVSKVTNKTKYC